MWPTEWERLGFIGNPRSLKEGTETYVLSPQPLDPAVAAVLLVRLLSEILKMQRTCCSLYTRAARWAAAAYDCMPMCIGSFSYTRIRLASLARFLFVGQSDVRLRSLLQGTRVTYVTETFSILKYSGVQTTTISIKAQRNDIVGITFFQLMNDQWSANHNQCHELKNLKRYAWAENKQTISFAGVDTSYLHKLYQWWNKKVY